MYNNKTSTYYDEMKKLYQIKNGVAENCWTKAGVRVAEIPTPEAVAMKEREDLVEVLKNNNYQEITQWDETDEDGYINLVYATDKEETIKTQNLTFLFNDISQVVSRQTTTTQIIFVCLPKEQNLPHHENRNNITLHVDENNWQLSVEGPEDITINPENYDIWVKIPLSFLGKIKGLAKKVPVIKNLFSTQADYESFLRTKARVDIIFERV